MTNKEVSAIFADIYNDFWMRNRDSLPPLEDEKAWDLLVTEGSALMKKYDCELATNMVGDLLNMMHQRKRLEECNNGTRGK